MLHILKNYLFEPRIAFSVFTVSILLYIVYLNSQGAFKDFVKFGPDPEQKLLGMKIDTWPKVIILYIIAFITATLHAYYSTVMFDFIHSKLWNPAYKEKINISKTWATLICCIEPIVYWLLMIVQFFITLTKKLQFILPELLGHLVIDIPYAFVKISEKKFV